jgi:hypothetical protein
VTGGRGTFGGERRSAIAAQVPSHRGRDDRERGVRGPDAVIVAVCAGTLLVLGVRPFGLASSTGTTGIAAGLAIAITILSNLLWAVLCLLKGKLWTGFFALFIPLVGFVGAIRVAQPASPWAHQRYGDKPGKLAKAQRREDHVNATWRAWREAFFDLIAGRPHLPGVATAAASEGAGASAREAPEEEAADALPAPEDGPGAETQEPAPTDPLI